MLRPCGHLSLCSVCATHMKLSQEVVDTLYSCNVRRAARVRCPICNRVAVGGHTVHVC